MQFVCEKQESKLQYYVYNFIRRRGRRCKERVDDVKEKARYRKLKEEALDGTVWRTGFGRRSALSEERQRNK